MSVRDARALLEDGTYLFFFLPPINYMYLFVDGLSLAYLPEDVYPFLIVSSMGSAAFVYNYNSGQPEDTATLIKVIYLVSISILVLSLSHTIIELSNKIEQISTVGNILLFISGVVVSLVVTHNIIGKFAEGYENSL